MEIRKRNGEMAAFDAEKIRAAMRLAFTATNVEITEQSLNSLLRAVLKRLEEVQQLTVENVQDQVEQQLMAEGYYETAKAYILYREKRAKARAMRERIAARMEDPSLEGTLEDLGQGGDRADYHGGTALGVSCGTASKPFFLTDRPGRNAEAEHSNISGEAARSGRSRTLWTIYFRGIF